MFCQFKVGDVIWSYRDNLEKGKHIIVICIDSERGFYINTRHTSIYDPISIDVKNHPFLGEDRFISCSELQNFDANKCEFKGTIAIDIVYDLHKHISRSKFLSQEDIELVLNNLNSYLIEKSRNN